MSAYKVWHVPQVPGEPFHVECDDYDTAVVVLNALAEYDLFQCEHNIKPDYCNASGIDEWVDGEWLTVDEDDEAVQS